MISIYTFWRQTLDSFNTTGAIAPSSNSLAKALTCIVARKLEPVRVLEVGAGTGVVTEQLVKVLGPKDRIDICEINPYFVNYLIKKFEEEKNFKNFQGKTDFLPIDVQKIEGEEVYDFIVSSLPLNAFGPEMVQKILEVYMRLLKPWGWLSYFEYIGIRTIKQIVSKDDEKQRICEVSRVIKDFIRNNEVFRMKIWFNLPPAYARHCQKRGNVFACATSSIGRNEMAIPSNAQSVSWR